MGAWWGANITYRKELWKQERTIQMVLVEFYRTLRNPSISEMYSFHSQASAAERTR